PSAPWLEAAPPGTGGTAPARGDGAHGPGPGAPRRRPQTPTSPRRPRSSYHSYGLLLPRDVDARRLWHAMPFKSREEAIPSLQRTTGSRCSPLATERGVRPSGYTSGCARLLTALVYGDAARHPLR